MPHYRFQEFNRDNPDIAHQARVIIENVPKGKFLTDRGLATLLCDMRDSGRLVTVQDPPVVFHYYRKKLIDMGILVERRIGQ